MPSRQSCLLWALFLSTPAALLAQNSINFGSGFSSGSLALNGSAALNGSRLELTNGGKDQAASAFYPTQVNVQAFTTDFTFQLTSANADGFTFVLQNAGTKALATAGGGGLGYGPDTSKGPEGIAHSVAVKFDLHNNAGEGTDSTGLYVNGASPTMPATDLSNSGIDLHSGHLFQVHMVYGDNKLTVVIVDETTTAVTSQIYSVNIPSVIGSDVAYAGFTAGTGGLSAVQQVVNWTYAQTLPGPTSCSEPISPVDTAGNTNVVGSGTPASCTESAFSKAIAAGGTVTFNCGPSPYRLVLTSSKSITKNTVIDGGNLITIDGGGKVRQFSINTGNFLATSPTVTLQNLTVANGHGTDNDGSTEPTGGGAIYRNGATLNVINSQFINNIGPSTGQDSAGGAIYSIGVGTTTVVDSVFEGNKSSDGGALGNLGASVVLVNDTIRNNQATGTGGNPGDGGNGGGLYMDGGHISIKMCGTHVDNNKGNAYGGGFFFVDDAVAGKAAIDQSSFNGNVTAFAGGLYLQGATGTLTNSDILNNQVEQIDGIGPDFPDLFTWEDSLGSLSSDNIDQ